MRPWARLTERARRVLADTVLALAVLGLWLPLLALCAYAVPALDDLIEATWGDFWALQRHRYATYTGRFVGSAAQALTPWHWQSLGGYRATALVRILLFAGSLAALVIAIDRRWLHATRTELLYLGGLLSAALLVHHPSPAQFFYWYSSSVIYCVPVSVLFLATALLLGGDATSGPGPVRRGLALAGFAYVAGNVEMLPLLVLTVAAPLAVVGWLRGRVWWRDAALATVVTAALFAVSALAPGNAVREAQMTPSRPADGVALATLVGEQTWRSLARWASQPATVLPALLALPVFFRRARPLASHHVLAVLVLSIASLTVLYVAPLWGLGFTVERVEAVVFLFFVLGCFALAWAVAGWARRHAGDRSATAVAVLGVAAASLAFLLLRQPPPSRSTLSLAYDELLSGRAAAFARADLARAELIRRHPCDDVVVPPLIALSYVLAPIVRATPYGDDVIGATPEEWWGNNVLAESLGKKTLRLGDPGAPSRCDARVRLR